MITINRNYYILLLSIIFLWINKTGNAQGNTYKIIFNKSGKIVSELPSKIVDGDKLIFQVNGYSLIPKVSDSINQLIIKDNSKKGNSPASLLNIFSLHNPDDPYKEINDIANTDASPVIEYKVQVDTNGGFGQTYSTDKPVFIYHRGCKPPKNAKVIYIDDNSNRFGFSLIKENHLNEDLIKYYNKTLDDWNNGFTELNAIKQLVSDVEKISALLKKDSNNMNDFYMHYPPEALNAVSNQITVAIPKITLIQSWVWRPAFSPFSFQNLKTVKVANTDNIYAAMKELDGLNGRMMHLKEKPSIKEIRKEYDSLDAVIDSIERKVLSMKKAYMDDSIAQKKNMQDLKSFPVTSVVLNHVFLYCTDADYTKGYAHPIYRMRNHDFSDNAVLMNYPGKDEYLESDKVMFLGHNATANQNVILNISVTPISGQNSSIFDGLLAQLGLSAQTTLPAVKFSSLATEQRGQEINDSITTFKQNFNKLNLKIATNNQAANNSGKEALNNYCKELNTKFNTLNTDVIAFRKKYDSVTVQIETLRALLKKIKPSRNAIDTTCIDGEWKDISHHIVDLINSLSASVIDIQNDLDKTTIEAKKANLSPARLSALNDNLNLIDKKINSNINDYNEARRLATLLKGRIDIMYAEANKIFNNLQLITNFSNYTEFVQSQHKTSTKLSIVSSDTLYRTKLLDTRVIKTVTTPNIVSYSFADTSSTGTKKASSSAQPKAMLPNSNAYKIDKLYRILPFAGFAYCTFQFTNQTLNSTGTAPSKLTLANPASTVVGLKFYLQKTNIRNDKFFIGQDDGRCLFLSRTSIDIGVGIPNPINNFYGGLGLDLIPGISINGGILLQGYPLYNFLNSQYLVETDTYRAGFYLGISTDATIVYQVAKLLNLTK